MNYNYNTSQNELFLKEYGRHIQDLVDHVAQIEDKEERNTLVQVLVRMMIKLNPNGKENIEFEKKVWDDIIIASNYKLDIDSPFDSPKPQPVPKKIEKIEYSNRNFKYKHYGKNVTRYIKAAAEIEEGENKDVLMEHLAKVMKTFYEVWNKKNVADEVIYNNMSELSQNKIVIDKEKVGPYITPLYNTHVMELNNKSYDKNKNDGNGRKKKPFNLRKDPKKYYNPKAKNK